MLQTSAEALASAARGAPPFRIGCWGDFAIHCTATGADLRPRGRKARALLAYLALHPGKPVRRERLAGLLWGDRGEEQARASLRQAIAELKPVTAADPPLVVLSREALVLDPAQFDRDIDAIARAVAGADASALAVLRPDDDELLFADLDDVDEGFDAWLAIERTRQADALAALLARPGIAAPPGIAVAAPPEPAATAGDNAGSAVLPAVPPLRRWRTRSVIAGTIAAGIAIAGSAVAIFQQPPIAKATAAAPVAIAVMPFASLAPGDQSYFAQGVSEEILAQLARNPQLKVLGRTSAWSLQDEKLAAPAIGRKLAVDYLVEGSVRTAGPDVRIDVALVRTSDGARIWSQQYPGRLDDIFAIQARIGHGVAEQLRRGGGVAAVPVLAGNGDARRLYLQARGMVRAYEPSLTPAAAALLRRAIALEPDFAPAHAALGSVLLLGLTHAQNAGTVSKADEARILAEARALAERALALQPNLAEAHRVLGMLAPTSRARTAYETAVRLDPNDSQSWMSLGWNYNNSGDYPRALDAFRRAVAIDPLWWPAFYFASDLAWDMGYPEEAEAYVRRVEVAGRPQPFMALMVRNDMAWRRGDFSAAFAAARQAATVAPANERFTPDLAMTRALRAVGRYADARRHWLVYPVDDLMWRMWHGQPPTPAEVAAMLADPACCDTEPKTQFMLSTLVSAGRTAEVVRIFDRSFASPEAMLASDAPGPMTRLVIIPLFALGLRDQGREADARRLLEGADAQARAIMARGRVPHWYVARHAQVLAAMGRRDAALDALETAVGRGWYYASRTSLADIADEPAFASIRDTPRFAALRAKLNANVARERREIDALLAAKATQPKI